MTSALFESCQKDKAYLGYRLPPLVVLELWTLMNMMILQMLKTYSLNTKTLFRQTESLGAGAILCDIWEGEGRIPWNYGFSPSQTLNSGLNVYI